MAYIPYKKIEANTPGEDTRGDKTADFKANVHAQTLKKAVMGRSKLPVKKGTHANVHLA